MLRRVMAGAVTVCVLALGVASATSMGVLDAPVATGLSQDVQSCTGVAELLDGSGNVITLGLPPLLPVLVGSVRVRGLDEDACGDATPIVVVIGQDPLGSAPKVLEIVAFDAPIDPGASVWLQTIDAGDTLAALLDVDTVVTELRVGFCPEGALCT